MARKFTTRAGAAFAALFVLAMWLNPLIMVVVTSAASADTGTVHCSDHSCCRRGHHQTAPASEKQVRSSCCPGSCCAFGQILMLKLGHFLPAATTQVVAMAVHAVVPVENSAVVLRSRDTSLFQRPPPA